MGISKTVVLAMASVVQAGTCAAMQPAGESPEARTELRITVYVYDYAGGPAPVREEARQELVRIYRAAGIAAEWVSCPVVAEQLDNYPDCSPSESRQDWVALSLMPQRLTCDLPSSILGIAAFRQDGDIGRYAHVCPRCLELLDKGLAWWSRSGAILGALMAHEIGHLLLATTSHSGLGVMRARWNSVDLKMAAQGRMSFTAQQAQQIRAQVRSRMGSHERRVNLLERLD